MFVKKPSWISAPALALLQEPSGAAAELFVSVLERLARRHQDQQTNTDTSKHQITRTHSSAAANIIFTSTQQRLPPGAGRSHRISNLRRNDPDGGGRRRWEEGWMLRALWDEEMRRWWGGQSRTMRAIEGINSRWRAAPGFMGGGMEVKPKVEDGGWREMIRGRELMDERAAAGQTGAMIRRWKEEEQRFWPSPAAVTRWPDRWRLNSPPLWTDAGGLSLVLRTLLFSKEFSGPV